MPAEHTPCPFCGNRFVEELVLVNRHVRCGAVGCPIRWQSMSPEMWNQRADTKECARQQPTTAAAQNTADTVE